VHTRRIENKDPVEGKATRQEAREDTLLSRSRSDLLRSTSSARSRKGGLGCKLLSIRFRNGRKSNLICWGVNCADWMIISIK
jgi:hypothetical protein